MYYEEYLEHYGVGHLDGGHSGRYPYGSGNDPYQHNSDFLTNYYSLKKQGLSETEIASGMGMKTSQLRARVTIARNEKKAADIAQAVKLSEEGMSNVQIGKIMGINESSVRNLLKPATAEKLEIQQRVTNVLKDRVDEVGFVDVGLGSETYLGVARTKMKASIEELKAQGYELYNVQIDQLGTNGNKTTINVLAKPGTTYKDIVTNKDQINMIKDVRSEDGGRTFLGLLPVQSISSDRIYVRDGDHGGTDKDGVIELRKGVADISLGDAHYAQVRIGVDGTHYLKGMAIYTDDIPKGYDIIVNSNKPSGKDKLDYFKKMKVDPSTGKIDKDNPFGATIKTEEQLIRAQRYYIDKNGKKQISPMNIVNEEGDWSNWSRTLSSQMLSKQSPTLAKQQLDLAYKIKKDEFDEINSLTNPAVKKRLLASFADDCDASAVHLKAAAMPRQMSQVILPLTTLKDTEVYAPNYKNGEKVVLIRYPHGGKFEIPELTVNNKNKEGKSIIANARDAIGINSKTAERLSGADFDGDTVIVIPNNNPRQGIKTEKALEGLKNFDPKAAYPKYEGMKVMSSRTKGIEMGKVSNLITDMTIRGANSDEICRAVRHSMVVIDAEKHELNYKQSYKDNNIAELVAKYQDGGGASTLISKSSSQLMVPKRQMGYKIDPDTGKKIFRELNETYVDNKGKTVVRKQKSTKMYETDDAFKLSSGTLIEGHYATYANKMKAMGDAARKEMSSTPNITRSPTAAKTYSKEVSSLEAKLKVAISNKPLERQAQIIANTVVATKKRANPNMDADEVKKVQNQALAAARVRTGASKQQINITNREWEAIQAGAISNATLTQILNNTDLDKVKTLATPRTKKGMTASKVATAKSMLNRGYTRAEVADQLGVSISTLDNALD